MNIEDNREYILNKVKAYFNINHFEEGINYLLNYEDKFLNNIDFFYLLTYGFFKLHKLNELKEYAIKLLSLDKENKFALFSLAYIDYYNKDLKNALNIIETNNLSSKFPKALAIKIKILFKLKEYKKLIDILTKLEKLDNKLTFYLLYSYSCLNLHSKAYEFLKNKYKYIEMENIDINLYYLVGDILLNLNADINKAQAFILQSYNFNSHLNLLNYYLNKKDYDKLINLASLTLNKFKLKKNKLSIFQLLLFAYYSKKYYNYVINIYENNIKDKYHLELKYYKYIGISYYLDKKDLNNSLTYLLNYHKNYIKDVVCIFYIGNIYFDLKDYKNAAFYFKKLINLNYNKSKYLGKLIYSLYKIESFDEILNSLNSLKDLNIYDILIDFVKYKVFIKLKKYDDAFFIVESIYNQNNFVFLDFKDEIILDIFFLMFKLNKCEKFIQFYKKVKEEDKDFKIENYDFYIKLIHCYVSLNMLDKAIYIYKILLKQFINKLNQVDKIKLYYELAKMYLKIDISDKFIEHFKNLLDLCDSDEYIIKLFKLILDKDRYDLIKKTLPLFEKVFPESSYLYYLKAEILFSEGDKIKARSYIDKALDINSNFFEPYVLLFYFYYLDKDIDTAYSYLKKAKELGLYEYIYLNYLGLIYMTKGDYKKAEKLFISSFSFNKDYIQPLYNLSTLYTVKGNYKLAEKYLKLIIKKDKKFSQAYLDLALIYLYMLNDIKMCLKYLKEALVIDSKNDKIYFYLGIAYEKLLDFDTALKYFKIAKEYNKELDPALILYHIGVAYSKKSDIDTVLNIYRQLKDLNKSLADKLLLKTKGL